MITVTRYAVLSLLLERGSAWLDELVEAAVEAGSRAGLPVERDEAEEEVSRVLSQLSRRVPGCVEMVDGLVRLDGRSACAGLARRMVETYRMLAGERATGLGAALRRAGKI